MADPILDQLRPLEAAIEAAVKANNPGLVQEYTREMQRILGSHNPSVTNTAFQSSKERLPHDIRNEALLEDPSQQAYAGAGAGALRLFQGVKQAVGGDVPQQSIDENKSLQTATGMTNVGGAAGTVLPFMALPGRFGAQLIAPGIRAAGGNVPSALQWGRVGTVADAATTGGALGAVTEPGGWEDRSRAGLLGFGGAAVPTGMVAMTQGARRQLTSKGRDTAIAEKISEDLGSANARDSLIDALMQNRYPGRQYGVSPSAAMTTGDPTLSVWELGSRTRQGDLWRGVDAANAQARWEELLRRSDPATNAGLRAERNAKTGALRDEAMEAGSITSAMSNSEGVPDGLLLPIRQKINDLRTGPSKPNGNVQHMADWLETNIDKATPAQLYEIRKLMTEDIPKGMNDQLGAALKGARVQRMELVKLIDDALDTVSGGSYGEYLAKYRQMSPEIASNSALGRIKSTLQGGLGEGVVPNSMGISPAPATLGRLLKKEGERTFGGKTFDQLTPTDRAWADALQQDLASQSNSMKAQGIVGSATAGNAEAAARGASSLGRAARESLITALTPTGRIGTSAVEAAIAKVSKMNEQELARLLQNPQALAEALRRAQGGEAIIRGAGQAGGSGGARALAEALQNR